MKELKKEKKNIGKTALVLCNIALLLLVVLFTVLYSADVKTTQEKLMLESFCNTVETMKQISEHYLSGEFETAVSWAAYIEQEHMTMDEAFDYIRSVSDNAQCEAHFVDMDTFDAWSTNVVGGSNTVSIYRECYEDGGEISDGFIARIRKIYAGEKYLLSKYTVRESQRSLVSMGLAVKLRQADGTDREYLLLRAVPVDIMRKLWIFPTSFSAAETGLINNNGSYIIPSRSMRSQNFTEFVRYYNFPDDFYGANHLLTQLKRQENGLLTLKDSKGQDCYWYYSSLNEFEGIDILGYIPVSELTVSSEYLSIVIAVSVILLIIALMDVVYILNINRRLANAATVARKASSAKTQFLSSMSHDIRTPLNAVLGMAELAQNHADDSEYVQDCLRKISVSGKHLLTLINDILEISRVESGRIDINPAPFSVRDFANELESVTRSQTAGRELELKTKIGDLPEPWLIGDRLRLTQICLNLLNNSVKYTEPGGTIRLEVGEERQDDGGIMLVCIVADTGIGMSEEFQRNMYDNFTRVNDSRIDKIQGTGLGLAIVKSMTGLMHGTIDCESAEGEGTTFTLRVPLEAATEQSRARQKNTTAAPENLLAGIHVLIAEDNDLNWEIISAMLEDNGISCERAENGRDCVDMLQCHAPGTYDIVFMDIQMPVLNGRDAARELRACGREDLRAIPIIAMTADAFAEDVQLCLDAGMNAHVAKPVEIEKVMAAIRSLLRQTGSEDKR